MYRKLLELLNVVKPHLQQSNIISSAVYVTMDWSGNPITTKGDGYILTRRSEMILNKQYYPTSTIGEWPCDPITGEKLPIKPIT